MEIQGMNAEDQTIINKLLDIMREQNMKEQAQNFEEVARYIVGMQVQLAMITNELHGIKDQLNQIQAAPTTPLNVNVNVTLSPQASEKKEAAKKAEKSVDQFEGKITQLAKKVSDTKTHLVATASKAVNTFKEKGKHAMNKVLQGGISGIENRLRNVKVDLADSIAAHANTAERINSVGDELKQAGNSFANIGRILSGKETKTVEISEEKRGVSLTRAIAKPIQHKVSKENESMKKLDNILAKLNKMSDSLDATLGAAKREENADRKETTETEKMDKAEQEKKTEKEEKTETVETEEKTEKTETVETEEKTARTEAAEKKDDEKANRDAVKEKLMQMSFANIMQILAGKNPKTNEKSIKTADAKENRESVKGKLSQMKEKVAEQQKEQTEPQKEKKQEACL